MARLTLAGAAWDKNDVRFGRVARSAVVFGVAVGLAVGALLAGACTAELARDLDEQQAREALATLARAGIAGERRIAGDGKGARYRIEVAASEAGRAAAALQADGLPRTREQGFAELYGGNTLLPSAHEEKARFLKALSGEIAMLLERFAAVSDASVLVTTPVLGPLASLDGSRGRATAAVLLSIRPGAKAPDTADVKRLVAGAVEGMSPDDVAVVFEARTPVAETALFVRVGPVRVAQDSRGVLVALLGGACAAVMAMGAWVIIGARRLHQLRRERERQAEP